MRSEWERRRVIKALAATAATSLFNSFAIPPAKAIAPAVVFAIVQGAIAVLNAIQSLNAKGGGLGEQFAAINLKLDQILQNQLYTLQAIAQLQKSIDALGLRVGGLLTLERYRSLAIAIYNLRDDFQRFSTVLRPAVGERKRAMSPTAIGEYNRLFSAWEPRLGYTQHVRAYEPRCRSCGSRGRQQPSDHGPCAPGVGVAVGHVSKRQPADARTGMGSIAISLGISGPA